MKTSRKAGRAAERAIQFRIQLHYISPPIWRRVVLPDNATLGDLHDVIQLAMGWDDGHMHSFTINGVSYTSQIMAEIDGAVEMEIEERVPLAEVVTSPGEEFTYEYDFGDGWEHGIVAEEFLPIDPGTRYPVCLDGARACPPEDCGGVPGYMDILEAQQAKKPDRDQQDILEWVGEYDPEHFVLEAVNKRLQG